MWCVSNGYLEIHEWTSLSPNHIRILSTSGMGCTLDIEKRAVTNNAASAVFRPSLHMIIAHKSPGATHKLFIWFQNGFLPQASCWSHCMLVVSCYLRRRHIDPWHKKWERSLRGTIAHFWNIILKHQRPRYISWMPRTGEPYWQVYHILVSARTSCRGWILRP